ncbi:nicotinamide-nucleotide adenylyltransferase [Patescibacteria group bacterium]
MQSALFIGRFQPFHNGHMDVIKKILKDNERVIIVIGSAEKNYVPSNPLTAGERFQLIETTLKFNKIDPERYCIIPVRNVNNYALWVNHINIYTPPYEKLYTGSQLVKACYEGKYSIAHRLTKIGPDIIQVKREIPVSATIVRDAIIDDEPWEEMVCPEVAKLLKQWEIPKRLQTIKDTMDVTKYNNSY